MRFFTAVNVLLLGVTTVVSALPIAQFTSSLDLESRDDFDIPNIFERDFDEPSLYRRDGTYRLALHKNKVGTADEHWALHFHPKESDKNAKWHVVDAASEKGSGGVLQTEHRTFGPEHGGYDKSKQESSKGSNHYIFGKFNNAEHAEQAAKSIAGINCEHPYPYQNCVDFAKKAVEKLHTDGFIDKDRKNEFMKHYNEHSETVRKNTGTTANKRQSITG